MLVSSLRQAATALNLPWELLRVAKAAGADGIDSAGRVDTDKLRAWIKANPDKLQSAKPAARISEAEARIAEAKAEEVEHRVAVKKRQFVPTQVSAGRIAKLAIDQKTMLRAKLENELPAKLVGKEILEIRKIMAQTVDDICVLMREFVKEWEEITE